MKKILHSVFSLVSLLFVYDATFGQTAVMDNTFGDNGFVTIDSFPSPNSNGEDHYLYADGKVLVTGTTSVRGNHDWYLVRFNADGSLDNSFGTSGKLVLNISNRADEANAVTVDGDGKILVSGHINQNNNVYHGAVMRLNSDGSTDNTFGTNGMYTMSFGSTHDNAYDMLVTPGNKIVVVGERYNTSSAMVVFRLNNDGTLDNTFGNSGSNVYTEAVFNGEIDLDNAGRIVALGTGTSGYVVLSRTDINGVADITIGAGGLRVISIGQNYMHSFDTDVNNNIYISGVKYNVTTSKDEFQLMKVNEDGMLDGSFGSSGRVIIALKSLYNLLGNVVVTSNAVYVTAAIIDYVTFTENKIALLKFDHEGNADNSFGTSGVLYFQPSMFGNNCAEIDSDASGNLIISGTSYLNNFTSHFVMKTDASGALITAYGQSGIASAEVGNSYYDRAGIMLEDANGKLLVAGISHVGRYHFAIARLNADGSKDLTFGNDGKVAIRINAYGSDNLYAIALDNSGNIILVGEAYYDPYDGSSQHKHIAVARLLPNGSLDPSFGTNGMTTFDLAVNLDDYATAVAVDANGKIVIGGQAQITTYADMVVMRLNSNGTLDNGFGTNGVAIFDFFAGFYIETMTDLVIDANGKIVITGNTSPYQNNTFVARITDAGILDNTFGTSGIYTYNNGTRTVNRNLLLDQNNILLIAETGNTGQNILITRLDNSGAPDNSFGTSGRAISSYGLGDKRNSRLMIDQNDKYVFFTIDETNARFCIVKLNSDGTPYNNFGSSGMVYFNADDIVSPTSGATVCNDNNIAIADNYVHGDGNTDFAVYKVNTEASTTGIFTSEEKSSVALYPNPCRDYFSFASNEAVKQVRVFASSGELVLTQTTSENTIDVKNLKEGVYFVEILTDKGTLRSKLIKK